MWLQCFVSILSYDQSSYFGYYPGGGACSFDPLTMDYSHRGWVKVAAGDSEFQKSLGCGMCVEIKGEGTLADLSNRAKIPKTPIIGPIYAMVIDRCGNCQKGNSKGKTCPFISQLRFHEQIDPLKSIADHSTSISANVIHCIACTLCKKIYIGETGKKLWTASANTYEM